MGELWLNPHLESWIRLLLAGPCSEGAIVCIDNPLIPFKSFLGVNLNDSALQFGVPPHLLCLNGFEVVLSGLLIFHFHLDSFHNSEVE